jgi:hypothetical protein
MTDSLELADARDTEEGPDYEPLRQGQENAPSIDSHWITIKKAHPQLYEKACVVT